MYRICRIIAYLIFILPRRITFHHRENIPAEGPVLFIANHRTMVDPIIVALATKRRVTIMAKQELFKNKLFGWFITKLGAFPVDREESDHGALRRSIAILKEGGSLIIFPEGTRNEGQNLLPFKSGTSYIASQVPDCIVVPVGICGADRLFKYFHAPVEVYVGSGLTYHIAEGETKRNALERFLSEQEIALSSILRDGK